MCASWFFSSIFLSFWILGCGLPSDLKDRGLLFISEVNPVGVIAATALANEDSQYFFSAFLKSEVYEKMDPLSWWREAATSRVPLALKTLASKIFVLPSSTGAVERNFSTLANIMTKQRNRLSIDKASKLCRIHNFLTLQQQELDIQKEKKFRNAKKRLFPNDINEEAPATGFPAPATSDCLGKRAKQ